MLESYFKDPGAVERLRCGPLGLYIEPVAASLADSGYTTSSIGGFIWAAGNLGRWLARNGLAACDLDEQAVADYLDEQGRQGRVQRSQRPAARQILNYLREHGVVPMPEITGPESAIELLLCRYEEYLRVERGLTAKTVVNYLPSVRRFLIEQFGDEPPCLDTLGPADVAKFLIRQSQSLSHGRAKVMTTALRSFFRFLLQRGEIDVDLVASVLSVANWRRAGTPKYLEPKDVERLLDACDQSTSVGCRNRAILLLLARLGLRAGEVVALELDDIDWRAGVLTVPGKGLRREPVPLPSEVGEALVTYLCQARPSCATRRVFVRTRAPHHGLANTSSVSSIVSRALKRADLHPPHRGAHLLRHSLATELLRNGASMAEIGQLLRHHSPSATEIYAKVDFNSLRSLALPWPGTGGSR